MKKVSIIAGYLGLILRKGIFYKLLSEGDYWLKSKDELQIYNTSEQFIPKENLQILLQNDFVKEKLEVKIVEFGHISLYFQNGVFIKVLEPGTHAFWVTGAEHKFADYNISEEFVPKNKLNQLLENEDLNSRIEIKNVQDNHIWLLYEDKNLVKVLQPGTHAFWKNKSIYSFKDIDLTKIEITEDIEKNTLKGMFLLNYVRTYTVEANQKGLLYVAGKYSGILENGIYYYWQNSISIDVKLVDLRQQKIEISGQEILTKDKATLRINFFATYKVIDVEKAMNENKDYENQLYILIQLALREFVGMLNLDEILIKKESVSDFILESVKEKVGTLGVEVTNCGVKDIILPGEIKEIMNQVLVAQKKAQANIITRREETASARSLLNTAKLMEENEMLYKLKEMEFIEKIADNINSITLSGGGQVIEQLKELFIKK